MYLEISPRASGKTFRLITAIETELANNPRGIVSLNTPSFRAFKAVREELKKGFQHRLVYRDKEASDLNPVVRRFYDEFDLIGGLGNNDIHETGYYVTTAARTRKIEELDFEGDFLLKLLFRNAFRYESKMISLDSSLYTPELLANGREKMKIEDFNREYLNQWIS
jgi:hypothetical protein